jgi:serine/threonine-protein kinase
MNDFTKTVPVRTGIVVQAENDYNSTVHFSSSEAKVLDYKTMPSVRNSPADQKLKTVYDNLIGGVNINPYLSLTLDVSSKLESSLEAVDARYAMLTKFAEGGTSTISIARDKNLKRLVAVKSLKRDADNFEERLAAFVTEAKVTAQLDHPGIIPIYGLSCDDDNGIYLIMKLVDGKTLREYLKNATLNYRVQGIETFDEDMLLRKRLEIFLRVCDTISYAHHRNVIHRDLKPENIMIGKYMDVFVMDWGLARVLSSDKENVDDKISGTLRYFPPEVLQGKPFDLRSDIFTLGLILQEVVTLQYAVTGRDEDEIIDHILKGQFEPIVHKFNRKIDYPLQTIIRKATAYKLEDRYQTAEALAEDVRRYMTGLSLSAGKENLWDRFLRFVFERILKIKGVGRQAT